MQGTTIATPVQSAGDALRASLAGALSTFVSAIPRIFGFAVILIAGWLIASLIARGIQALLRAVNFNELAERSGLSDFVHSMGVRTDSAGAIAGIAKWFIRLITLVVAFDMLGLPAVSQVLQQLLLWLPNLVVALVVLILGGLAARALSQLARGATTEAGFTNPDVLATVTRIAIWALAVVVAVDQLGIATTLINTLLVGVIGALALATGLAFGLGGRDRAAQILDRVGREAQGAGPRLQRAADAAGRQAGATGGSKAASQVWVERSGYDRRRTGGGVA
jgi:hypothetical protein